MIRIIDGRRYDTDKAQAVADYIASHARGDFRWMREVLYRTPAGRWFLCGTGGPMTPYAQPAFGGGWTGGEDIIRPMAAEEARAWLETRGELAALEQHFGNEIEDA
jgi:hypothetical protein